MNTRELETLIQRHLDGLATEQEVVVLSGRIEHEAEVRVLYLQLADLHAALAVREEPVSETTSADISSQAAEVKRTSRLRTRPSRWWIAIAASLVVAALSGLWILPRRPAIQPAVPLATLTGALNLRPARPGVVLQPGQTLGPGMISISAGVAQITLQNGVQIVFEGPGELELLTPMRAVLNSGQAVLRVPENAHGFELATASAKVIDLGTEFAVKAGPGLSTEIQVYDGEVVTTSKATGAFARRMTAGQAVMLNSQSQFEPVPAAYAPARFVRKLPDDKPIEHGSGESANFNPARFDEIVIPRPENPIFVDGNLSEWSDRGLVRSERQHADGKGCYVEVRLRHDQEHLFIGARIGDHAPMRNVVDPATDCELGWRGGGLQIRLSTDRAQGWPVDANSGSYYLFRGLTADATQIDKAANDRLAHLTLWHHSPSKENCLHIAYGMDYHGGVVNPAGYHGAFLRNADGLGYTMEYAIPWNLLHASADPPHAGDVLGVSWTAHWSDESGRLWRGQHVELRNSAEPTRIHTWERAATWGRAVFQ